MDFKSIISGFQLQWENKSAAKKEMDGAKQFKKKKLPTSVLLSVLAHSQANWPPRNKCFSNWSTGKAHFTDDDFGIDSCMFRLLI